MLIKDMQRINDTKQQHLSSVHAYLHNVEIYNQMINDIGNLRTTKRLYGNVEHLKLSTEIVELPIIIHMDDYK